MREPSRTKRRAASSRPAAAAAPAGATILVVDDARDTLELVQRNLTLAGFRVLTASRAADAMAVIETSAIDLVITDIRMPGRSGIELIRDIRAQRPALEVIVITGYATIEGAVEALQVGAWDYLSKPFTEAELLESVRRVLARAPGPRAAARGPRLAEFHGLLGDALVTRAMFAELEACAPLAVRVLLCGEPGSGREAAARALHAASGRGGEFARVSLDGRAGEALAGEVAAALRACAGGTLYLAALEAIAAGTVARIAAQVPVPRTGGAAKAAPRIVASTALSGETLAARRSEWRALFARTDRTIVVPPLRERGDDVVLLAGRFLTELAALEGTPVRALPEATANAIHAYAWPGNVGELRGAMTAVVLSGRTGPVTLGELPAHVAEASTDAGTDLTLLAAERRHVADVLRRAGGNKSRAAEILGIDRKTLREKLRQLEGDDGGGDRDA